MRPPGRPSGFSLGVAVCAVWGLLAREWGRSLPCARWCRPVGVGVVSGGPALVGGRVCTAARRGDGRASSRILLSVDRYVGVVVICP